MSDPLDWNAKTIAEFRANEGRVGGNFEGAPMVVVHHRGRKSGREYVNPTMHLPHDTEQDIIYVFATKGGAPHRPSGCPTDQLGVVGRRAATRLGPRRHRGGRRRHRAHHPSARERVNEAKHG
jgi:F420H(2)-dependent quinone reductase